jgi:PAS domain S-box-containing protein
MTLTPPTAPQDGSRPSDNSAHAAAVHDFEALVANTPMGVFTATPEGRFLSANPAMVRLLGYDSEVQLVTSVRDIAAQVFAEPEDRRTLVRLLDQNDELVDHECWMVRRDGKPFWASATVRVVRDDAGRVLIHQGFLSDISERKRAALTMAARDRLQNLARSGTLTELLRGTLVEAEELTGSRIGFFHFFEDDQSTIVLQTWSDRTIRENCTAAPSAGTHYPVSQAGVWADCVHTRAPVIHNDYAALPHRRGLPEGHAPILREMVVPVQRDGRIVAILGVGNKPTDYGAEDLDVLTSLADLAWDIAERKRAEETLLESEERYRRITECLTDYLYTVRVEGGRAVQTVHSPACVAVTGFTAEEFAADPYLWINMVLPEDQDKVREQARQVLKEGRADPVEHRIILKDGQRRWVSNTIVVRLNSRGELAAYDGLIKDITERKNMDQALRESEARVRNKLDALLSPDGDVGALALEDIIDTRAIQLLMEDFHRLSNIGSAIVDLHGKVLVATGWQDICVKFHRAHPGTLRNCIESDTLLSTVGEPGTFRLYKCKNNLWDMATPIIIGGWHLGNMFLGQFLFEDDLPELPLFQEQAQRYGFDEKQYIAALDRVPRYGRETVHQAMAFYARLADLLATLSFGQIKLARAMAEQAQVKDELRRVNARLEQTLADKDKFFAIIAHDLRSPFIGFLSFIRLMVGHIENMSQEDIRKLAEDMKGSAENLYNLLNNLLDWARMQRGLTPFEPQPQPLSTLIRGTLELIEPSARQKSIALHCLVPEHISILADHPMLSTVVRNLLFNAVKFTQRDGEVSITAEQDEETVRISIRDTGVGMDEAVLCSLFALDRRTCLRGTEGERGSGLGLLLCKEFVEKHGGRIWVESEPGQGTIFSFTLPRMS